MYTDHDHTVERPSALPASGLGQWDIATIRRSGAVPWRRWLERMGGRLGFALLMCGLACFLAGNWAGMSNAARLGVMQGGLAGFVLLGMASRGKRKNFSALCLLGASLMVGAFWIVFSQIYQTGADPWQLFALWALGVSPWLLLAPSVPIWLLWIILANIGLTLWGMQNGVSFRLNLFGAWSSRIVMPALYMNAVLWLGCVGVEWWAWRRRNAPLLRVARRWGVTVLPFLLGGATLVTCEWLLHMTFSAFDSSRFTLFALPLANGVALAVLGAVAVYERITRRVGPFCLLALCGFPLLNCVLALMVADSTLGDIGFMLFLFGSANLGYTALVLHTLAALRHTPHESDSAFQVGNAVESLPMAKAAAKANADISGDTSGAVSGDTVTDASANISGDAQHTPDPHTLWTHKQKAKARHATQQVGQGVSHLLSALGGLLSSAFLICFAVYMFGDRGNPVSFAAVMAALFLAAGVGCVRIALRSELPSSFLKTLALCLSLCGWFFLISAVWIHWESPLGGIVLLPAMAVLYVIQPQPVWRFLSVGSALTFVITSLLWVRAEAETSSLLALLLLTACALPLYVLAAWGKWRPTWLTPEREHAALPCLYATLGVLIIFLPTWSWLYIMLHSMEYWLQDWSLVLLAIPVTGLIILLVSQCFSHYRLARTAHKPAAYAAVCSLAVAVAGLVLLYFLTYHVARSFLLVLILPLLGHACRLRLMERVGLVLFGIFLFLHYYSWHVSFLDKAYNMTVVGFVLLAVAIGLAVWRRHKRHRIMQASASPSLPSSSFSGSFLALPARPLVVWSGAALVALGLTLASFQYFLQDREKVLAQGETLMFALAPVDPLSLVQGYYMALAYEADGELSRDLFDKESPVPLAPEGYAVFQRTPDDPLPIAQLKDIRSELGGLAPGEYAVPYRLDMSGSPSLSLPSGYLMEESKALLYEQAKYGVFRCVPGVCVLTGLADGSGQVLP